MEAEGKCKHGKSAGSPASTPVSPTLNLMEQLLLAKMERHSVSEAQEAEAGEQPRRPRPRSSLLRTDSMDSQTSASTFSSLLSNESTGNRYCRCDDCLLGIADSFQQAPPSPGRKKVNAGERGVFGRRFWLGF